MSAAEVYARVKAACCSHHGFETDEELEAHVRSIVKTVLQARGVWPA